MAIFDIEYGSDNGPLEELLLSVDRPGDFCTHGRLFAPMPRLEVDGVGLFSVPVPEAQVGALIAAAERAPYGKGPDTLVDTSVRTVRTRAEDGHGRPIERPCVIGSPEDAGCRRSAPAIGSEQPRCWNPFSSCSSSTGR